MILEALRVITDRDLVIIGDGPARERLRATAGPNVRWLGRVDATRLGTEIRHARALLFAAEEDFGVLPVKTQACGIPVLAYVLSGATETFTPDKGHLCSDITTEALVQAAHASGPTPAHSMADYRAHAERLSVAAFQLAVSRREIAAKE